jgi:superfamily I DNA/RNA helicase
VLALIRRLNPGRRAQLHVSVWKENRVPFDRIYADEVQDSTQAEITLFLLSVNNNVDFLFLAGDNAQAITHGVSFRFQELRQIIARTDPGRTRNTKPVRLLRNYRSHSGVLEFAAAILDLLATYFPKSFQKLDQDAGLSRGPRPGAWSCPHGTESLKKHLQLDERLVVITRDENARQLEGQLGPALKHVHVLGVCEAKGLEFNDVLLVDFFSSAPSHLADGWEKLLAKPFSVDAATNGPAAGSASGGGGGGSGSSKSKRSAQDMAKATGLPLDLEVDFKVLYTAITRCRNRLVVCETGDARQWNKFKRQYESLGLITKMDLPESGEPGKAMMADELVERGLDFIERIDVENGDPEQMERDYGNAIKDFERANAVDLLQRARTAKKHAHVWDAIRRASDDTMERERLASAAADDFLAVGMGHLAARLCAMASGKSARVAEGGSASAAKLISQRLSELDRRWKSSLSQGSGLMTANE